MRIRSLAVVGSILGLSMFVIGPVAAVASDLQQPLSVQQVAYELDRSMYLTAESASPSDATIPDEPDEGVFDACDAYDACDACAPACSAGSGLTIGGWLAMGYTANGRNVQNPPGGNGNLPVTFNYRANDFQLNQLNLFLEQATDTGGYGWDLGGRIDLLFGEDYFFTQAAGLETRQNGDNRWNVLAGGNGIGGAGRYGLAMPQVYGEVAYNDLKVKVGHFYTIIGYEVVPATGNFFYSHAYTMQYAEPFTHTGAIATWEYADRLTLIGGIVNGWDKFDAVTDRASFIGGFIWTSPSERASLAVSFITGDEDGSDAGGVITGNRTMYSVVFSLDVTDDWQYVLQHDLGVQENGIAAGQDAGWYGLNQYLFYTLNDTWAAGIRYEFFIDQNGTRVDARAGTWQELAVGLNWTPNDYMVLRPELRWDRFNPSGAGAAAGPFNDNVDRDQFLFGIDLILTL